MKKTKVFLAAQTLSNNVAKQCTECAIVATGFPPNRLIRQIY